jgi:hypothetical protein
LGIEWVVGIQVSPYSNVGATTRVGLLPLGGAHVIGDHTGRNAVWPPENVCPERT